MNESQNDMLLKRMKTCGSFERALIKAWFKADKANKRILEQAFENTQFRLTRKETAEDFAIKEVYRLERHMYAPELNTLHFEDGTSFRTPGCVTIADALAHVQSQIS